MGIECMLISIMKFDSTSDTRRRNMRAIRAKGNKSTEGRFRGGLVRRGISGWTMHSTAVPGCPDFFFQREQVAVFIDGCFWHSCPKCGHVPRTNTVYWSSKLARNKERDFRTTESLQKLKVQVLRMWECDVRDDFENCFGRLSFLLRATRQP